MFYVTGSVSWNLSPVMVSATPTTFGPYSFTGSVVWPDTDRTGQIVTYEDTGNVYLVRESEGNVHTLAHHGGGEWKVHEDSFAPFGGWKRLAG